jgi:hypothetical protein
LIFIEGNKERFKSIDMYSRYGGINYGLYT